MNPLTRSIIPVLASTSNTFTTSIAPAADTAAATKSCWHSSSPAKFATGAWVAATAAEQTGPLRWNWVWHRRELRAATSECPAMLALLLPLGSPCASVALHAFAREDAHIARVSRAGVRGPAAPEQRGTGASPLLCLWSPWAGDAPASRAVLMRGSFDPVVCCCVVPHSCVPACCEHLHESPRRVRPKKHSGHSRTHPASRNSPNRQLT